MSGVDLNLSGLVTPRREHVVVAPTTVDNSQTAQPSTLATLSDRYRITNRGIGFDKLSVADKR